MQAGNSIGGAISDDGELIAVSNYEPGGVRVFDAETLEPVADIPADRHDGKAPRPSGLVDLPGRRVCLLRSTMPARSGSRIFADPEAPTVTKLTGIGKLPYDGNVTPDGRHYLAGLFGEDGVVHVDTVARSPLKAARILDGYGHGEEPLPVYKMPHLEGWAPMGDRLLLPAVGRHELIAVDTRKLRRSRPRRDPRAAGVRGGAARRPARLGQFRASAQRHDRGRRYATR